MASAGEVREAINHHWAPHHEQGPGWRALKTIKQLGIDCSGGTPSSKPVFDHRNSRLAIYNKRYKQLKQHTSVQGLMAAAGLPMGAHGIKVLGCSNSKLEVVRTQLGKSLRWRWNGYMHTT